MTPPWPKANSECERFMKNICKAMGAVHVEHNNWKQEMYNFLRNYRATPHATLKKAPAEFYFQGILRLDNLKLSQSSDKQLRHTDKHSKQNVKVYAD